MLRRLAALLIVWVSPAPSAGEEPRIVDSIEIVVQDVFEDEPEFWAYRLANRLHVETDESVIRRELLFREGDPVSEEALAQTERNLRALPFLRNARVETHAVSNGRVRVRVVASDSWSTEPEVRLAKVGNEWIWGAGATESNLFGRGKAVSVLYDSGIDRNETYALYRDPRLLGSRVRFSTILSVASDGHLASLAANRPFFEIGTRWGFNAEFEDFERIDPLYSDGESIGGLRHLGRSAELDVARAVRRRASSAVRLHAGYGFSDDDVELERRRFGILRLGATSVGHRFLKLTHVNRFERPEDVNLGNEAGAFLGVSTEALGGEPGTAYFFSLFERRGFSMSDAGFARADVSWRARYRNDRLEQSVAQLRIDAVQKLGLRRVVLAKAELQYGTNLDPEVQIRLGAESGLRGYPVRQFNGDRSLLLSMEARWFLVDELLRILSVGGAAFVDSGYAWPEGSPLVLNDLRSNVGVGLLVGLSRTSISRPGVRIDVAYALNPLEGRSRWLVSAGSKIGF